MRWIREPCGLDPRALRRATIEYHFDPGAAPQWTGGGTLKRMVNFELLALRQ